MMLFTQIRAIQALICIILFFHFSTEIYRFMLKVSSYPLLGYNAKYSFISN
jgi:hypothetical protein